MRHPPKTLAAWLHAPIHVLTRRSYFTSIFVSLGVFLFGYDQGVMSGIITYVSLRPRSGADAFCVRVCACVCAQVMYCF